MLEGVSSLAPGESAVFIKGDATTTEAFEAFWFGGSPPAGFKIGTCDCSGLGTGGDAVNVFEADGSHVAGITFGSSTSGQTFDNTAAIGSGADAPPTVSTLSVEGVNGAFTVGGEAGSPGATPVATSGRRDRGRALGQRLELRRRLVGADQLRHDHGRAERLAHERRH